MERGERVDKCSRKKGRSKKVEGGRWKVDGGRWKVEGRRWKAEYRKMGRWEYRERVGQVLRGYYYRHASKRIRVSEGLISPMTS